MKFREVIKAFIDSLKNENNQTTLVIYQRKIDIFYEYVTVELKAHDINYISVLTAMDIDDFLNSAVYYVKVGNIKSRATVDLYYSVLNAFYKFVSEQYGWRNDCFTDTAKITAFKKAYEGKIAELGLQKSRQEPAISDGMARNILHQCDQIINGVNMDEVVARKRGSYSNYISAIIVKLVLLYGFRNDVIKKIEIGDYDKSLNKLVVNRYRVTLPDGLAVQMKEYVKIRERFLLYNHCEKLFFDDSNLEKDLDNTKMFLVLNRIVGNNQARAVAKHAIIRMLKNGVPSHVIMDFTGYKKEVLEYCQDVIDEEKGMLLLSEKCRILDSALRNNDLFDDM